MIKNGLHIDCNGSKVWYKDGKYHREGGKPAVEIKNGTNLWYLNDLLHREEGPAIIYCNGNKEWWIHGNEYIPEEHPFNKFRLEYNLSDNYEDWSIDMKILFKLTHGGL